MKEKTKQEELELKLFFSDIQTVLDFIKLIDVNKITKDFNEARRNLFKNTCTETLDKYVAKSVLLFEVNANIVNLISDYINVNKL